MDRSEILQRFEQWLDATMASEDPPPGIPAEILSPPRGGGNARNRAHRLVHHLGCQ